MPGVSKTQRAEAKYNVTLDFPHLGLHSAASSGNLGLVTYALDHGQPVNSVVDGVLPLHVACSGGNDLIVRLLIERGADVNAPRLPRKYSNDRHRAASAPIVGTSGATPLHFAAANGHENVVLTLLLHGAHPDRGDKYGVTPQMVARQNGWTRCADLLSQWTHEKDKDLREREVLGGVPSPEPEPTSRLESLECKVFEKKLKVKRSIDNALHMLRPALSTPPSSGLLQPDSSYSTSTFGLTESPFVDSSPELEVPSDESHPRRPSLPYILDPSHHMQSPHGFSSHRHHHRRLRGKISLLHMFKKSTGDSAASTPGFPATPDSRDSLSGYASSSSAFTSASGSPAPERDADRSRGSSTQSPLRTRASESGLLSSGNGSAHLTTIPSSRSRLTSESRSTTASVYPPLAVELHRKLSAERLRARSGSGSSASGVTEARAHASSPQPSQQALPPHPQLQGHRSPSMRPGILRPHHRSTSSGQSMPPPPLPLHAQVDSPARSLRFDSSASVHSISSKRSGLNLKVSNSVSSLRGEGRTGGGSESPRSPRHQPSQPRYQETQSKHVPTRHAEMQEAEDDDEEGYGEVISPRLGLGLALPESKSRVDELKMGERQRHRRPSAGSQMSHDSSSLPSPTGPDSGDGFDCPFSINRPPPQPLPLDAVQSSQSSQSQSSGAESRSTAQSNTLGIHGTDNRGRGDSIGSMSTSTDVSTPQTPLPAAGSSVGFGLGLQIRSPDVITLDLPPTIDFPPRAGSSASASVREEDTDASTNAASPRARTHPLDIDIRAISSHAQAEALVQRAQRSILDPDDGDIELPGLGLLGPNSGSGSGSVGLGVGSGSGGLGSGRTPLSAKLAAYGESLAIERRMREREREKGRGAGDSGSGETPFGSPTTPSGRSPDGRLRPRHSERALRKYSLEERSGDIRVSRRSKPKRPHTADGDTKDASLGFLSPRHKPSHSSSAVSTHTRSASSTDDSRTQRGQPTSARTLPIISSPSPSLSPPRIVRSRTPDPASRYLSTSPPTDGGAMFGVPLSRVSTAPPRHGSPDLAPQRSLSEQERQLARANKLMKMGLATYDALPRSRARSPYGHARNAGGGSGGGGAGAGMGVGGAALGKQRFGGIRGFVQTLTGKS
ncbi:hypothetical protein BD413DRAFT_634983 [Trametes elegans]|nr:hypothetical protein BD413DRAFT_634983 [Trametes elegans]